MTTTLNKKYTLSTVGALILIVLVVGVFYALLYIKDVLQGAVGEVGEKRAAAVRFDFKRMELIEGLPKL